MPGSCVRNGAKPTHSALATPAVASARLSLRQVGAPSSSQDSFEADASAAKHETMTGAADIALVLANRPC